MGLKNQQLLRIFLFICFSQGGKTSFNSGSVSPFMYQAGPLCKTDPVTFKDSLPCLGRGGCGFTLTTYYLLTSYEYLTILESCLSEKGEEVLDHVLQHYFFFPPSTHSSRWCLTFPGCLKAKKRHRLKLLFIAANSSKAKTQK